MLISNIFLIFFSKKVCFVFIDNNERQIILETDEDISRTRTDFVEGQLKKGMEENFIFYLRVKFNIYFDQRKNYKI